MTLYLLPNVLAAEVDHTLFLPKSVDSAMTEIDGLIAESEGGARRYLKRFQTKKRAHEMPVALLSEDVDFLLQPVRKGEIWGVVSDAGLPCLADPGAKLVKRARGLNIPMKSFAGPSSITMALILSGLTGQRFSFRGYISKEPAGRKKELLAMEASSRAEQSTQIFIETPYRNHHTFDAALQTLGKETLLTVAADLTLPTEQIVTQTVEKWRRTEFSIEKRAMIFLLFAPTAK